MSVQQKINFALVKGTPKANQTWEISIKRKLYEAKFSSNLTFSNARFSLNALSVVTP